MIPLLEAQRELIDACPRLPAVELSLTAALGCVCAVDLVSPYLVPPFDNSSVDGYAVRSIDVIAASHGHPVELAVLGSVLAGSVASLPVGAGQAWKVMTGAPVPAGADAIVMVENTSARRDAPAGEAGDTVEVFAAVAAATAVRSAGSNILAGDIVVERGTTLRPTHLGVLASVGIRAATVYPRPRVGVLVTGDELVTADRPLEPGEIYDANSDMMMGLLTESDCEPARLGIADDDPQALADQLLEIAADYDAVVTTGGVSMGDADPVKDALALLGALQWRQVSIRPAKPFAFGMLSAAGRLVPVFGLPGNPVSSLVSFELLARPALRAMAGHTVLHRAEFLAVADADLAAIGTDGRTTYLRVQTSVAADGRLHALPVAAQDSHQLAQSAHADGLAVLPPGTTVPRGGDVTVRSLRWDG